MVQVVHVFVERLPVGESVDAVEMKLAPERNHEEPQDEILGMRGPIEVGDVTVGIEPHGDDFVASPDEGADAGGPKNIVPDLVVEKEASAVAGGPLTVVFLPRAFAFDDVEVEVITAVVEPNEGEVTEVDLEDPSGAPFLAICDGGLSEAPGGDGD